jgi:hypothetical protein
MSMRLWFAIPLIFSLLAQAKQEKHWEFGVALGDPLPLSFQVGYWWNEFVVRACPGGWYQSDLTLWAGAVGSIEYAVVQRPFYGVDVGASYQYFYAQAKDNTAITINETMGQRVLYDAQWEYWMAVAPQMTIRYFHLFTQLSAPIWQSGEIEYKALWRAGFVF